MAEGDRALAVSMVLVVVGTGMFGAGVGSGRWVEDRGLNDSVHYSLWQVCRLNVTSACSVIDPGASKAYFEATRVLVCVAAVMYAVTVLSCFTASDDDPCQSVSLCLRRYLHVSAAFTAGGLTFLAIVIFATCYEDDDWFLQPTLGYSFWLTLAGFVCSTSGAIMRVLFIFWPKRPGLPARNRMRSKWRSSTKKTSPVQSSSEGESSCAVSQTRTPPLEEAERQYVIVEKHGKDEEQNLDVNTDDNCERLGSVDVNRFFTMWHLKASHISPPKNIHTVYDAVLQMQKIHACSGDNTPKSSVYKMVSGRTGKPDQPSSASFRTSDKAHESQVKENYTPPAKGQKSVQKHWKLSEQVSKQNFKTLDTKGQTSKHRALEKMKKVCARKKKKVVFAEPSHAVMSWRYTLKICMHLR